MATALKTDGRQVTFLEASLDQAVHRCIDLASASGTIRLFHSPEPDRREFMLDVSDQIRFRWTFRAVAGGTELTIARQSALPWLTGFGRRAAAASHALSRKVELFPHLLNLRIAVLGGGTGLYTTLLALRDRTPSLSAVISGLPRAGRRKDPKDEIGGLPLEDASLCLVALAPTVHENSVLRQLLEHRVRDGAHAGTHLGTVLLQALAEVSGSMQSALDEAGRLLRMAGRIVIVHDLLRESAAAFEAGSSPPAVLTEADMIVIAPGNFELDIEPVLSKPTVQAALRASSGLTVAVARIMTAEHEGAAATASGDLHRLSGWLPRLPDVALVNVPALRERQLRAYAAMGSCPIVPDVEAARRYARRIVREPLAADGDLARHDPQRLGDALIQIGSAAVMEAVG